MDNRTGQPSHGGNPNLLRNDNGLMQQGNPNMYSSMQQGQGHVFQPQMQQIINRPNSTHQSSGQPQPQQMLSQYQQRQNVLGYQQNPAAVPGSSQQQLSNQLSMKKQKRTHQTSPLVGQAAQVAQNVVRPNLSSSHPSSSGYPNLSRMNPPPQSGMSSQQLGVYPYQRQQQLEFGEYLQHQNQVNQQQSQLPMMPQCPQQQLRELSGLPGMYDSALPPQMQQSSQVTTLQHTPSQQHSHHQTFALSRQVQQPPQQHSTSKIGQMVLNESPYFLKPRQEIAPIVQSASTFGAPFRVANPPPIVHVSPENNSNDNLVSSEIVQPVPVAKPGMRAPGGVLRHPAVSRLQRSDSDVKSRKNLVIDKRNCRPFKMRAKKTIVSKSDTLKKKLKRKDVDCIDFREFCNKIPPERSIIMQGPEAEFAKQVVGSQYRHWFNANEFNQVVTKDRSGSVYIERHDPDCPSESEVNIMEMSVQHRRRIERGEQPPRYSATNSHGETDASNRMMTVPEKVEAIKRFAVLSRFETCAQEKQKKEAVYKHQWIDRVTTLNILRGIPWRTMPILPTHSVYPRIWHPPIRLHDGWTVVDPSTVKIVTLDWVPPLKWPVKPQFYSTEQLGFVAPEGATIKSLTETLGYSAPLITSFPIKKVKSVNDVDDPLSKADSSNPTKPTSVTRSKVKKTKVSDKYRDLKKKSMELIKDLQRATREIKKEDPSLVPIPNKKHVKMRRTKQVTNEPTEKLPVVNLSKNPLYKISTNVSKLCNERATWLTTEYRVAHIREGQQPKMWDKNNEKLVDLMKTKGAGIDSNIRNDASNALKIIESRHVGTIGRHADVKCKLLQFCLDYGFEFYDSPKKPEMFCITIGAFSVELELKEHKVVRAIVSWTKNVSLFAPTVMDLINDEKWEALYRSIMRSMPIVPTSLNPDQREFLLLALRRMETKLQTYHKRTPYRTHVYALNDLLPRTDTTPFCIIMPRPVFEVAASLLNLKCINDEFEKFKNTAYLKIQICYDQKYRFDIACPGNAKPLPSSMPTSMMLNARFAIKFNKPIPLRPGTFAQVERVVDEVLISEIDINAHETILREKHGNGMSTFFVSDYSKKTVFNFEFNDTFMHDNDDCLVSGFCFHNPMQVVSAMFIFKREYTLNYLIGTMCETKPEVLRFKQAGEKSPKPTMNIRVGEVHDGAITLYFVFSCTLTSVRIEVNDSGYVNLKDIRVVHHDGTFLAAYRTASEYEDHLNELIVVNEVKLSPNSLEDLNELLGNYWHIPRFLDSLLTHLSTRCRYAHSFTSHLYSPNPFPRTTSSCVDMKILLRTEPKSQRVPKFKRLSTKESIRKKIIDKKQQIAGSKNGKRRSSRKSAPFIKASHRNRRNNQALKRMRKYMKTYIANILHRYKHKNICPSLFTKYAIKFGNRTSLGRCASNHVFPVIIPRNPRHRIHRFRRNYRKEMKENVQKKRNIIFGAAWKSFVFAYTGPYTVRQYTAFSWPSLSDQRVRYRINYGNRKLVQEDEINRFEELDEYFNLSDDEANNRAYPTFNSQKRIKSAISLKDYHKPTTFNSIISGVTPMTGLHLKELSRNMFKEHSRIKQLRWTCSRFKGRILKPPLQYRFFRRIVKKYRKRANEAVALKNREKKALKKKLAKEAVAAAITVPNNGAITMDTSSPKKEKLISDKLKSKEKVASKKFKKSDLKKSREYVSEKRLQKKAKEEKRKKLNAKDRSKKSKSEELLKKITSGKVSKIADKKTSASVSGEKMDKKKSSDEAITKDKLHVKTENKKSSSSTLDHSYKNLSVKSPKSVIESLSKKHTMEFSLKKQVLEITSKTPAVDQPMKRSHSEKFQNTPTLEKPSETLALEKPSKIPTLDKFSKTPTTEKLGKRSTLKAKTLVEKQARSSSSGNSSITLERTLRMPTAESPLKRSNLKKSIRTPCLEEDTWTPTTEKSSKSLVVDKQSRTVASDKLSRTPTLENAKKRVSERFVRMSTLYKPLQTPTLEKSSRRSKSEHPVKIFTSDKLSKRSVSEQSLKKVYFKKSQKVTTSDKTHNWPQSTLELQTKTDDKLSTKGFSDRTHRSYSENPLKTPVEYQPKKTVSKSVSLEKRRETATTPQKTAPEQTLKSHSLDPALKKRCSDQKPKIALNVPLQTGSSERTSQIVRFDHQKKKPNDKPENVSLEPGNKKRESLKIKLDQLGMKKPRIDDKSLPKSSSNSKVSAPSPTFRQSSTTSVAHQPITQRSFLPPSKSVSVHTHPSSDITPLKLIFGQKPTFDKWILGKSTDKLEPNRSNEYNSKKQKFSSLKAAKKTDTEDGDKNKPADNDGDTGLPSPKRKGKTIAEVLAKAKRRAERHLARKQPSAYQKALQRPTALRIISLLNRPEPHVWGLFPYEALQSVVERLLDGFPVEKVLEPESIVVPIIPIVSKENHQRLVAEFFDHVEPEFIMSECRLNPDKCREKILKIWQYFYPFYQTRQDVERMLIKYGPEAIFRQTLKMVETVNKMRQLEVLEAEKEKQEALQKQQQTQQARQKTQQQTQRLGPIPPSPLVTSQNMSSTPGHQFLMIPGSNNMAKQSMNVSFDNLGNLPNALSQEMFCDSSSSSAMSTPTSMRPLQPPFATKGRRGRGRKANVGDRHLIAPGVEVPKLKRGRPRKNPPSVGQSPVPGSMPPPRSPLARPPILQQHINMADPQAMQNQFQHQLPLYQPAGSNQTLQLGQSSAQIQKPTHENIATTSASGIRVSRVPLTPFQSNVHSSSDEETDPPPPIRIPLKLKVDFVKSTVTAVGGTQLPQQPALIQRGLPQHTQSVVPPPPPKMHASASEPGHNVILPPPSYTAPTALPNQPNYQQIPHGQQMYPPIDQHQSMYPPMTQNQGLFPPLPQNQQMYPLMGRNQPMFLPLTQNQLNYPPMAQNQPNYPPMAHNQPNFAHLPSNHPQFSQMQPNQVNRPLVTSMPPPPVPAPPPLALSTATTSASVVPSMEILEKVKPRRGRPPLNKQKQGQTVEGSNKTPVAPASSAVATAATGSFKQPIEPIILVRDIKKSKDDKVSYEKKPDQVQVAVAPSETKLHDHISEKSLIRLSPAKDKEKLILKVNLNRKSTEQSSKKISALPPQPLLTSESLKINESLKTERRKKKDKYADKTDGDGSKTGKRKRRIGEVEALVSDNSDFLDYCNPLDKFRLPDKPSSLNSDFFKPSARDDELAKSLFQPPGFVKPSAPAENSSKHDDSIKQLTREEEKAAKRERKREKKEKKERERKEKEKEKEKKKFKRIIISDSSDEDTTVKEASKSTADVGKKAAELVPVAANATPSTTTAGFSSRSVSATSTKKSVDPTSVVSPSISTIETLIKPPKKPRKLKSPEPVISWKEREEKERETREKDKEKKRDLNHLERRTEQEIARAKELEAYAEERARKKKKEEAKLNKLKEVIIDADGYKKERQERRELRMLEAFKRDRPLDRFEKEKLKTLRRKYPTNIDPAPLPSKLSLAPQTSTNAMSVSAVSAKAATASTASAKSSNIATTSSKAGNSLTTSTKGSINSTFHGKGGPTATASGKSGIAPTLFDKSAITPLSGKGGITPTSGKAVISAATSAKVTSSKTGTSSAKASSTSTVSASLKTNVSSISTAKASAFAVSAKTSSTKINTPLTTGKTSYTPGSASSGPPTKKRRTILKGSSEEDDRDPSYTPASSKMKSTSIRGIVSKPSPSNDTLLRLKRIKDEQQRVKDAEIAQAKLDKQNARKRPLAATTLVVPPKKEKQTPAVPSSAPPAMPSTSTTMTLNAPPPAVPTSMTSIVTVAPALLSMPSKESEDTIINDGIVMAQFKPDKQSTNLVDVPIQYVEVLHQLQEDMKDPAKNITREMIHQAKLDCITHSNYRHHQMMEILDSAVRVQLSLETAGSKARLMGSSFEEMIAVEVAAAKRKAFERGKGEAPLAPASTSALTKPIENELHQKRLIGVDPKRTESLNDEAKMMSYCGSSQIVQAFKGFKIPKVKVDEKPEPTVEEIDKEKEREKEKDKERERDDHRDDKDRDDDDYDKDRERDRDRDRDRRYDGGMHNRRYSADYNSDRRYDNDNRRFNDRYDDRSKYDDYGSHDYHRDDYGGGRGGYHYHDRRGGGGGSGYHNRRHNNRSPRGGDSYDRRGGHYHGGRGRGNYRGRGNNNYRDDRSGRDHWKHNQGPSIMSHEEYYEGLPPKQQQLNREALDDNSRHSVFENPALTIQGGVFQPPARKVLLPNRIGEAMRGVIHGWNHPPPHGPPPPHTYYSTIPPPTNTVPPPPPIHSHHQPGPSTSYQPYHNQPPPAPMVISSGRPNADPRRKNTRESRDSPPEVGLQIDESD